MNCKIIFKNTQHCVLIRRDATRLQRQEMRLSKPDVMQQKPLNITY